MIFSPRTLILLKKRGNFMNHCFIREWKISRSKSVYLDSSSELFIRILWKYIPRFHVYFMKTFSILLFWSTYYKLTKNQCIQFHKYWMKNKSNFEIIESNPSNPRGPKLYNELYAIYSLVVWVGVMRLFIIYYLINR